MGLFAELGAAVRRGSAMPVRAVLAGQWMLAGVSAPAMEHSDETAAVLAAKLGRPQLGPWPEQLLGLLEELAARRRVAPERGIVELRP